MKTVKIGLGTCGISAGGEKVYQAFQDELKENPNAFELKDGLLSIIFCVGEKITYCDLR